MDSVSIFLEVLLEYFAFAGLSYGLIDFNTMTKRFIEHISQLFGYNFRKLSVFHIEFQEFCIYALVKLRNLVTPVTS